MWGEETTKGLARRRVKGQGAQWIVLWGREMGKLGAFSNVEAPSLAVVQVQVQVLVNLEAKAKAKVKVKVKVKGLLYLGVYEVFWAF